MIERTFDARRVAVTAGLAVATLGAMTLLIWVLEGLVGVANASAVYLLAVMVVAIASGTFAAVLTAIVAFLLYDLLFVDPIHQFVVADPAEWLNLVLLLLMGIVVGQLAGAQRDRALAAELREREARALFQVSRALATRERTVPALGTIVEGLRREAGMSRVWIVLGSDPVLARVAADSAPTDPPVTAATHAVLKRMPGDEPAKWIRVHAPAATGRGARRGDDQAYRVDIEAGRRKLGALWALRARDASSPSREEARMLAGAADQVGQALEQDRLAGEAQAAEIARQGDRLKSALLESVSHDLRTPLATIRAAAGTILDRQLRISDADRAASAEAIDREAEHLGRLVTNLLDLSRIEAGALRADREVLVLEDAIAPIVARLGTQLAGRSVDVNMPASLPPVLVDPVFLDQIVANLLENAAKHVPAGERIRVSGTPTEDGARLTVEDSGPGVPIDALPHLFEKFYRVPGDRRSRKGTGIGLAVVRGLADAMGGRAAARSSALGGLAIDLDLPAARPAATQMPAPPEPGQTSPAGVPASESIAGAGD